jgi:O-antigen/teichoic acid export membrane protein
MIESSLFKSFQQMKTFGSVYLMVSVLEKSLSFILIPIYTTYLTPEDYGIYGMLSLLTLWIQKFAVAPVGNGITRMYHAPENKEKQGEFIFNSWLFVFLQMVIICVLYVLFHKELTALLFDNNSKLYHLTLLFTYVLMLKPFADLMNNLLRIQGKAKIMGTVSIIRFVLVGSLQVYLLVWMNLGVKSMIYGLILSQLITIFILSPILYKELSFKLNFSLLKPALHYGYPLIIAAISSTSLGLMDKYLLRINWDIALVGKYVFAIQMGTIMNVVFNNPLKQSFVPVIFKMEKDKEKLLAFFKRSCTFITIMGSFVWLCLSSFIFEIISVLVRNPSFKTIWYVVPFLAFLNFQMGMATIFGNGIGMARKSTITSFISFGRLIVTSILLFIFIPKFSVIGAASSLIFSQIIANIIRGKLSTYYYGHSFETVKIVSSSLIAILLYVLIYFVMNMGFNFYFTFIVKISILAFYPIILYSFGIINTKEIKSTLALLKS